MPSLEQLLDSDTAQIYARIDVHRIEIATGISSVVRVTDAPIMWTTEAEPVEADRNQIYSSLVVSGWGKSFALSANLQIIGGSPTLDALEVVCIDAEGLDGLIIGELSRYTYADQPFIVRLGGIVDPANASKPFGFENFGISYNGTQGVPSVDAKGQVRFKPLSLAEQCDTPVVVDTYGAWGQAIQFPDNTAEALATVGSVYDLNTPVISVRGVMRGATVTNSAFFRIVGHWGLAYRPGRRLALTYDDGLFRFVNSGHTIPDGDFSAAARVYFPTDPDMWPDLTRQLVAFYIGDGVGPMSLVSEIQLPTAMPSKTAAAAEINSLGPGHTWDAWEIGIGDSAAISEDRLLSGAQRPEVDPSAWIDVFRNREGVGAATTTGENSTATFTLVGSATIIDTYTGDGPEIGGGLLGVRVQAGYGSVERVEPVPLHGRTGVWTLAQEVSELRAVTGTCTPLDSNHGLTAVLAGDLEIIAPNQLVIDPSIGKAWPLYPGQLDPARRGQRVELAGWLGAGTDGTYTVKTISEDGSTVYLADGVDPFANPDPVLESEAGPVSSEFRALDADVQYDLDLHNDRGAMIKFRVPSLTPPNLRFSGILRPEADAAEIADRIQDAPVIDLRTFARPLGRVFRAGETGAGGRALPVCDILTEMDLSGLGWHIYDDDGNLILGTYEVPTGPADIACTVSSVFEVFGSGETVPPIVAPIIDLQRINIESPYNAYNVGHSRTWSPLTSADLPGSVTAADRLLCTEEYRREPREFEVRHGRAKTLDVIRTLLGNRLDASDLADVVEPFLRRPVYYWRATIGGLAPLQLAKGSTALVEHPDPGLGFVEPVLCGIIGGGSEVGDAKSTLTLYVLGPE